MRCPFCGKDDTQVKDSRASEDGATIRRRRLCTSCGSRFTTFERIQLRDLIVIKRNGKKIQFERDKILKSMLMALRKRQTNDEALFCSNLDRFVQTTLRHYVSTYVCLYAIGQSIYINWNANHPIINL